MGQGTNVLYPAAGGSDDWALDTMLANQNNGPLSYTYELRDTGTYGFVLYRGRKAIFLIILTKRPLMMKNIEFF